MMCSSPKTNSSYVAPKKPSRALLAKLTSQQRQNFARIANQAQERRELKTAVTMAIAPHQQLEGSNIQKHFKVNMSAILLLVVKSLATLPRRLRLTNAMADRQL
jgi:uncharacterized membrane protein